MASIIAYLENYVESTVGLPSDLARFLNTIRVLDDRASEVEAALRGTTEALCALKPVGSRQGGADNPVSGWSVGGGWWFGRGRWLQGSTQSKQQVCSSGAGCVSRGAVCVVVQVCVEHNVI